MCRDKLLQTKASLGAFDHVSCTLKDCLLGVLGCFHQFLQIEVHVGFVCVEFCNIAKLKCGNNIMLLLKLLYFHFNTLKHSHLPLQNKHNSQRMRLNEKKNGIASLGQNIYSLSTIVMTQVYVKWCWSTFLRLCSVVFVAWFIPEFFNLRRGCVMFPSCYVNLGARWFRNWVNLKKMVMSQSRMLSLLCKVPQP